MGTNNKAEYEAKKAKGLCPRCGRRAPKEGIAHCQKCLDYLNAPSRSRLSKYGETGVERLARQEGRCAICCREISIDDKRTHIDHCHEEHGGCGKVRAVLCMHCNTVEGYASKLPNPVVALHRLAEYLDLHGQKCPDHERPVFIDESRYLTNISDSTTLPSSSQKGE